MLALTSRSFPALALFGLTLFISSLLDVVRAERHTVRFDNRCGFGTPRLIQRGNTLSRGEDFTSDGPFYAAIAYLQTGKCLLNGENCSVVEMSLVNPTCPGCGSSTDISLIPPLGFSVPVRFSYFGGCNGQGATCSHERCSTAFFKPDDNHVQVACQANDVNLLITFCPEGSGSGSAPPTTKPPAPKPPSPQAPKPTRTVTITRASTSTPILILPDPNDDIVPATTLTLNLPTSIPGLNVPFNGQCPSERLALRRERLRLSLLAGGNLKKRMQQHRRAVPS